MKSFTAVAVLAGVTAASPVLHSRQLPDNTQPSGTNPIQPGAFSAEFLGNQLADNSCTHRDLGFAGHISGTWYAIYGDNLWCSQGVTDPEQDPSGFHGIVRDSVSLLGNDPLKVHDLNLNDDTPVPHPNQFVPFNTAFGEAQDTGFGGTSLVETNGAENTGALYYLVNENSNGLKGAGVAKVEVQNGTPTVTQRYGDNGWWWDANNNPHYGDIAAYQDEKSSYIYILGNPPNNESDAYVYQARVNAQDAFDLSKYEYWWGRAQGWKSDVLTIFNSETAVMSGVGQGQLLYSNHFQTYLYVHMGGGAVQIRAAPSPEGPWTADQLVYQDQADGGFIYSGLAYPYLDTSGKTLTVAWTNNNHIRVAKVTFN